MTASANAVIGSGALSVAHAVAAAAGDDVGDAVLGLEALVVVVVAGQHQVARGALPASARRTAGSPRRCRARPTSAAACARTRSSRAALAARIRLQPGGLSAPVRSVSSATKWTSPQSYEYQRSTPARAAVLGQHEHLPKGGGVRGLVFVVAAGREDRPRRQQRRVDAEELALEVAPACRCRRRCRRCGSSRIERDGLDLPRRARADPIRRRPNRR